jgi:hypothetical protein
MQQETNMTKNSTPQKNAKTKAATRNRKKTQAGSPGLSKSDRIIALLRRAEGASLVDMMKATGWQQHSLRGFMSGNLVKQKGLTITSDKVDGERHYRIVEAGAAA